MSLGDAPLFKRGSKMRIFTVGQVAKILKVSPQKVLYHINSGHLRGYRIPGSQDRRIPREYLIQFLKEHGIPLGDLEDEPKTITEAEGKS
jgi:two-component system, OmpR family, response regulator RpaA